MNNPPRVANNSVFVRESNIPAKVPEGHRYLQNIGVNLKKIGRINTIKTKIKYFNFLSNLSPLKLFIFFGKGILYNKSCKNPKGQKMRLYQFPFSFLRGYNEYTQAATRQIPYRVSR